MRCYEDSPNVSSDCESLHSETYLDSKMVDCLFPLRGIFTGETGLTRRSFHPGKDNLLVIASAGTDSTNLDDIGTDGQLMGSGETQRDLQAINLAVESMDKPQ